jgi:hypothetical protein
VGVWATSSETPTIEVYFVLDPNALEAEASALGLIGDPEADEKTLRPHARLLSKKSQGKLNRSSRPFTLRATPTTLDNLSADKVLYDLRQVDLSDLPASFDPEHTDREKASVKDGTE